MEIQLIRNATLLIYFGGKKILVDPMLSKKGSLKPVPFTLNRVKIPTVPLPVPLNEMINVDAILVTHIHYAPF